MDGAPALEAPGLVGPNAVIQLANVLEDAYGPQKARRYFERAGYGRLFDDPPEAMIDQTIPAALLRRLCEVFPPEMASNIASQAGCRTADYIMAHRIPVAARLVLRIAPAGLSAKLLLAAIRKHAWTFAGSGSCETTQKPAYLISIRENPLAVPDCAWHVAVFERLFGRLVCSAAKVRHVACCLDGGASCKFEIELGQRQREPR